MFAQLLESAAPPKMAIVDVDGQADPAATTSRLVTLCGGDCRLVIVGSKNDVTLYRRILNAGAVDYLVKPLTQEILNQALAAALKRSVGASKLEAKEAKVIVFLGARGGVGTSLTALNVSWIMAHELKQNVTLFDLDLSFGTSALALDVDPGHGLRDIVSSPNHVDALMIASSLVTESDNFSLLSAEEAVDEITPVDNSAIAALIKEMKGNFDIISVDLPRSMIATQKRLLSSAHEIVVISDLTLAGIRDTLRIKNSLTSLGCTAKITLAAARANASGAGQITRATFEKGIKGTVDLIIPEDVSAVTTAANSGKALGAIAPRATITKTLREFASKLAEVEDGTQNGKASASFWNKLTSDGKHKAGQRGKP